MKQLFFLLGVFLLTLSPLPSEAATGPVSATSAEIAPRSVSPPKKEARKKYKKHLKRKAFSIKDKRDSLVVPVLFWWILAPLLIAGLFTLVFLTPFFFFWWIALGALVLWAGISGIVFFPIQYFSFPAGLLLIVLSLILKMELTPILFLMFLTGGIALVLIAMFALGFMVLMFTIGAKKYQEKPE